MEIEFVYFIKLLTVIVPLSSQNKLKKKNKKSMEKKNKKQMLRYSSKNSRVCDGGSTKYRFHVLFLSNANFFRRKCIRVLARPYI